MKKASEIDVDDDLDISNALTALANKLDSKDAQILNAAVRALNRQISIVSSISCLNFDLEDIKREAERDLRKYPDQAPKIELASSIHALDATCRALRGLVPVDTLELLASALNEIIAGAALPAMFHTMEASGRRRDGPSIMAVKAILAGLMRANQDAGMSRKEAAKWIVKYISPELASRISSKPLTARVVEEWLDRYGGKGGECEGPKISSLWSRDAMTPQGFRQATERIAKIIPQRKHK